jgi:putative FmdB family regulatory protein
LQTRIRNKRDFRESTNMPTYDYICDACEHAWELFQKMTDDPIKKCPECGKKKAVRQFGTGAAIMFKGSGFYETDYRSESYKKSKEADKKSKSEASSGSKSDSNKKSETKSDSSPKKSDSKKKKD